MKLIEVRGRIAATVFACIAFVLLTPNTAHAAETNRSSGFLKALGGFLNRENNAPTNSTTSTNANSTPGALESLEEALLDAARDRAGTNSASLTQRLSAFLRTNSPAASDNSAATNITQKLRDWLQASQSSRTNTTTNTLARRAWAGLTNAIATHSLANSVSATNSAASGLSGTNLVQKLKDWVAAEREKTGASTNAFTASLVPLDAYLTSLRATLATNEAFGAVTNLAPAASEQIENLSNRNSDHRRFRQRRAQGSGR